jgi:DNA-binding MarR family transcriptional regulator
MTKRWPLKGGRPLLLPAKVAHMVQSLATSSFVDADPEPRESGELAFVADEVVTRALEEWQARASYLSLELLSGPAWGMLLELLEAEIQDRTTSLSRIRKVSAVPASTADRWLNALERQTLVVRSADPMRPNDDFICLSRKGSSTLRRYFHQVVQSRGEPQ